MPDWDTSTWIAVIALSVSVLSFVISALSAWVSHCGLTLARQAYEQERHENFEKQRSSLLEVINTSRSTLDRTRIEIGTLKAIFGAEPQPVQTLLSNYTALFTEYLPRVEAGVRQAASLWDEVADWDESTGITALVHHEARYRALLHEDQMAHENALYLIAVFKEKLEDARRYVSGAVR